MAVDFSAELQRLAGGVGAVGTGMQHRAAVTQAGHPLPVQQVCVDAGYLLRGVCAQAHHAARQLVDEFEGKKV